MAKKPNIFVFTADHSGLPLARRFQEEGHGGALVLIRPERRKGKLIPPKTAEDKKEYQERTDYLAKNGNGLVKKMWVDEAMKVITRQDIVIFDQIYGWQYGEALFKRGVPVLGGAKVGFTLETERLQTLNLLKKMGFDIPPYKSFGPGSAKRGMDFLKAARDQTLFAFKSDNPSVETSVAHESNDELIQKLTAEHREIDGDGFLLQEKKQGIELAVETWAYRGVPIMANVDLEAKKLYNEHDDVQTGCAMTLTWSIPVDHPLRVRLNKPMDSFVKKHIGTGLMDIGVIYDPHEDKMWVLECCGNRFAYNAFYNLMALCQNQMPLGEFFVKYLTGDFKKDVGEKVFGTEVAGSVRVFNHKNAADQHIAFPKELAKNYWLWDCHKKGGDLLTTGGEYGDSLGIVTATGENPQGAMAKVRDYYTKLYMPKKYSRPDYDEDDEINLPIARFEAMKAAKML